MQKPQLHLLLILRAVTGLLGFISLCLECFSPELCGSETKTLDDGMVAENPLETANLYSIWSFSWMTPLLRNGASQFVTEEDLPPLPSKDESKQLGEKLEKALEKQYVAYYVQFAF